MPFLGGVTSAFRGQFIFWLNNINNNNNETESRDHVEKAGEGFDTVKSSHSMRDINISYSIPLLA